MKKPSLLPLALSAMLLNSVPALAQLTPNAPSSAPRPVMTQTVTLPESVGIVVIFPSSVAVDAGQGQAYPLTLPLAQTIYDDYGNVLIPENTPVSVQLMPIDGGMKIVAQSLLINGRIVPIQASSSVIPGTTVVHMRANDKAVENGAIWGRIGGSLLGVVNQGDPDSFDFGAMGGSLLGLVTGLRSEENTRVVQIAQGSVHILIPEAPITIPVRVAQTH